MVDPNNVTPADVYALGLWMIKVLYATLVMGLAVVGMVTWCVVAVNRSVKEKRALSTRVQAMLSAIQAEGKIQESQSHRTRANLEKTEKVLEKIVTAAQVASVPATPTEPLPVVVLNAPDHPIPVAPSEAIPEGFVPQDTPQNGIRLPRPAPGA
jgi:hypothetical protein